MLNEVATSLALSLFLSSCINSELTMHFAPQRAQQTACGEPTLAGAFPDVYRIA